MVEVSWDELKTFVEQKNISLQFIELLKYYKVFAFDGIFSIGLDIQKTTPSNEIQADFETNYKNLITTNRPVVQQTALTLADDKLVAVSDAFSFTAAASSTTQHTYLFNDAYLIRSISFLSANATLADYIKVEVVDVNNILGLGANFVLATPITKAYVMPTTNAGPMRAEDISAAELPVAGLFLRISYTNTAILTAVTVFINLNLYKRI